MNIKIICVGTIKEKFFKEAIAEYAKRLKPFCNFEVCEIPECKLRKNFSNSDIINTLDIEKNKMLSYVNKNTYTIAMCIEGKELSSIELSELVKSVTLSGKSSIAFIIGSSFGLDNDLKNSADFRLSMSKFTLPHQLARVVLVEQIYRAFQIIAGTKYHK